jgi:hypothetical protein
MNDTRLLGRWRSDATRTRKELAARRDIPAGAKRRLARLFGKLELRFTRSRCHSTLNGHTETAQYVVLAKDATSVATLSGGTISHIHFETGRFWIHVGGGKFREYFRRV